ncbi:hypothetical protein V4U86_16010 [Mycobacterium sp. AMU20-3851]|uniref:hypothetical protein n=1 Tax=Mycobacterium sp. AMU20-3851 TaxID=3122055 RepID=UPI003754F979
MKKMSGGAVVYLGYVLILLAFVALGACVAALAFGSPSLALGAGIALVVALGAGVAVIRSGLRIKGGIWSKPAVGTASRATWRPTAKRLTVRPVNPPTS